MTTALLSLKYYKFYITLKIGKCSETKFLFISQKFYVPGKKTFNENELHSNFRKFRHCTRC